MQCILCKTQFQYADPLYHIQFANLTQQLNISVKGEASNVVKCTYIVTINQIILICIIAGSINGLHNFDISNIVHTYIVDIAHNSYAICLETLHES